MRAMTLPGLLLLALAMAVPAMAASTTQTIVMIRHGEKPAAGLGQLNCQGLNRALALPAVIDRMFGRPTAIYAPDPGEAKMDDGQSYDYVRPLVTIEPTAISLGMPIHAGIGVMQTDMLRHALEAPGYHAATVVVAWEHHMIVRVAQAILTAHEGNPNSVPDWKGSDFDSIYVIRITWNGGAGHAVFERQAQNLDGQSTTCPGPAAHS